MEYEEEVRRLAPCGLTAPVALVTLVGRSGN